MLRKKEVFQSPSEFGFRKIFESSDPDPDLCETICAMMTRSGTNLEGRSQVIGTGRERRVGPATNESRYDVSTSHPKPLPLFSFFLFLPSFFHT